MLSLLISDKAEFETFDTEHYWNVMNEKEAAGEEFIDIEDMYGYRAVSLVRDIKCPHCGNVREVDLEDYMYYYSSDECENGMGPDCVYTFDTEENSECPDCEKVFRIEGWIEEYPMGSYDSVDINTEIVDNGGEG